MKFRNLALVSALALSVGLAGSSLAYAGHHHHFYNQSVEGYGPQGFAPTTIADIRQRAYDKQIVVLKGRLTNYLGHDHYEFSDGTGVIELELDDDYDWSFISKNELIMLTAEVDRDFMSVTLEGIRAVSLERGAASMPQGNAMPPAAADRPTILPANVPVDKGVHTPVNKGAPDATAAPAQGNTKVVTQ